MWQGLCEGHFMAYVVGDEEKIYPEHASYFHWLVLLVSEAGSNIKELLYIKTPVAVLHFRAVLRHSFCFVDWIRVSLLQTALCQENVYRAEKCWGRMLLHSGLEIRSCNLICQKQRLEAQKEISQSCVTLRSWEPCASLVLFRSSWSG